MVRLENISMSFRKENQRKLFGREVQEVLKNIDLSVHEGECLAVLGESGSGKSTLGKIICRLLEPTQGKVVVESTVGIVFQDYLTSMNPRFTIRQILDESLRVRERREGRSFEYSGETLRLLSLVGLNSSFVDRYPHELSGGQLQRVAIARAIAIQPRLILFDEAISSLDAHTQVEIMDLLLKLKEEFGFTYIFITHDITCVTYFCTHVVFLHQGKLVERCEVRHLNQVVHDYSKALLYSVDDEE